MHRTSRKLKFIHYADDTTVYMSGNNLTRLCEEVCEELWLIDDWLKSNRLSLNINKNYCMIHTHSNYDLNDCDVRIRNTPITFVKIAKFLGITIKGVISKFWNFLYYWSDLTEIFTKYVKLNKKHFLFMNIFPFGA